MTNWIHMSSGRLDDSKGPKFDFGLTYYLAGPMTGLPEFNYEAFEIAAHRLRETGIKIASPREIDFKETRETRGTKPYQVYVQEGFRLLLGCDGIILLRGWPASRGARRELDIALDLNMPAYFFDEWTLTCMNGLPRG